MRFSGFCSIRWEYAGGTRLRRWNEIVQVSKKDSSWKLAHCWSVKRMEWRDGRKEPNMWSRDEFASQRAWKKGDSSIEAGEEGVFHCAFRWVNDALNWLETSQKLWRILLILNTPYYTNPSCQMLVYSFAVFKGVSNMINRLLTIISTYSDLW